MRAPRRQVGALVALTLALISGCESPAVAWRDVTVLSADVTPETRLALGQDGVPALVREDPPAFRPPDGACDSSVVFARVAPAEWFAAWWQPRPDGSAALAVARTLDGGATWGAPVIADGRDRSTDRCDRPAPAIAAQGAYVHLAYALRDRDVPGVWFTHSMEHGPMEHGTIWHAPVPVVFGDVPTRASVAAHGDTVAVAYEDPNSARPRVALALSRTAGHIFEERLDVSGAAAARAPAVALAGRRIAVAWAESPAAGGEPAVLIRTGVLK